jgi:hypothetical protein
MRLNRNITYDQFLEILVVKRKLLNNGNVTYKGFITIGNVNYIEEIGFHINEPEDIPYYDTFARDQLIRKLLIKINRGK